MINFGRAIKKYREKLNIKQKDLAEKCNITSTYLSAVENNRKEPSLSLLAKVSAALKLPKEILFWDAVELDDKFSQSDVAAIETAKDVVNQYFTNLRG